MDFLVSTFVFFLCLSSSATVVTPESEIKLVDQKGKYLTAPGNATLVIVRDRQTVLRQHIGNVPLGPFTDLSAAIELILSAKKTGRSVDIGNGTLDEILRAGSGLETQLLNDASPLMAEYVKRLKERLWHTQDDLEEKTVRANRCSQGPVGTSSGTQR